MKPIRVMHFRREVLTGGGPESLIIDISRHIDRANFEMSVVVFAQTEPTQETPTPLVRALQETGTPTFALPARHRIDPRPARHLARLLDEQQIDILHCHDHRSNLIAYLATRRRPTRTVATLHQPLRRYWWLWHWEALDEWIWQHFDRMLPVAEAVGAEVVGKHPGVRDRVVPILNGVDLERFHTGGDRERIRRELGIEPDAILCLTIGRFLPDKGLDYLLQAAQASIAQRRDLRFVLAGQGPLESALRDQSHSLDLNDHVVFAGFRRDVPDLLAAADMVLVSSTSEGCSVAILEAMACGRAVIATRVGGTPEIVHHGVTGILVEPRRPDLLADAIVSLAGAPAQREQMGQAAADLARQGFSIQRMVRRIEQVYASLMARAIP